MGHVALMGDEQNVCRVLLWKPEARNHMEDLDVHRRIIFSLSERIGRVDMAGFITHRIGTSGLLPKL